MCRGISLSRVQSGTVRAAPPHPFPCETPPCPAVVRHEPVCVLTPKNSSQEMAYLLATCCWLPEATSNNLEKPSRHAPAGLAGVSRSVRVLRRGAHCGGVLLSWWAIFLARGDSPVRSGRPLGGSASLGRPPGPPGSLRRLAALAGALLALALALPLGCLCPVVGVAAGVTAYARPACLVVVCCCVPVVYFLILLDFLLDIVDVMWYTCGMRN